MKLSEALDRFFVVPFNSSVIVDWSTSENSTWEERRFEIAWEDHDEKLQRHEFPEQEIVLYTADAFMAKDTNGDDWGFMALTGANLHIGD